MIAPGPLLKKIGHKTSDAVRWAISRGWQPYSRLIPISDSPVWSLWEDMRQITALARQLGIRTVDSSWAGPATRQSLFFASQYLLLLAQGRHWGEHRVATAYFHGKPGSGSPEFDECYENLRRYHAWIQRVQVSHSEMRDIVLETGISPEKVFMIPIGINLDFFTFSSAESRRKVRALHKIPEQAVVVGSFQKDGVGWGDGLEPKLIKGPDVLLRTVALLRQRVPELFVLLSGPARGYVKAGLENLGVPYRHLYLRSYPEVGQFYQALDVYIVSSRQEGGPKAVLESMASGVPLVTTRVGQAMDLVQNEKNGWMVESEDFEGLAFWAEYAVRQKTETEEILKLGRRTAEANTYESQLPLWRDFMTGFVNFDA